MCAQITVISRQPFVLCMRNELRQDRSACLLLHGFPGAPVLNPPNEKNRDIGEYIADTTGIDTYLPHYTGLGQSSGLFSFVKSIRESQRLAAELVSKQYETLHIVGHSWGGLVAVNVYNALVPTHRGNLILMSPFSLFPSPQDLRSILSLLCANVPVDFEAGGIDGAVTELETVDKEMNPRRIVHQWDNTAGITVVQATSDDEVPCAATRSFVAQFRVPPHYVELDTDHGYVRQRDRLKILIAACLRN